MKPIDNKRRQFIKAFGASLVLLNSGYIATSFSASNKKQGNKKLVWVVLRGAMDSLDTVVPTFDNSLASLRPKLQQGLKAHLLPLDDGYALHPSLVHFKQLYKDKQLLPIVAVGSGYGARSHFDGQDYLESGLQTIDHDSGWLGRAVNLQNKKTLAVARSIPISLREKENGNVSTWYPTKLKEAGEDVYQTLLHLYQDDPLLLSRLKNGLAVKEMANMGRSSKKKVGKFINLTKSCAKLMIGDKGADCAMLELGGWDTHNNQINRLARQLETLDQGLKSLQIGLGDEWKNTVVVVASEFGRTAKENGTGGTDHGTGGAMFFAGGAIKGGRVLGDWPGLKQEQLFKNRDLKATTNSFSWIAAMLAQQFSMSSAEIKRVFPDNEVYQQQIIT